MNAITLQSPGEVLFSLGQITVHWYGVMIALAFLAGLGVALHIAKQEDLDQDEIINLSTILLVGSIICARLYYVIFNWSYFASHPTEILALWQGGLSIHGVIIGGALILFAYSKIKKIPLLKYMDLFACGLPLGQSIGRWGNFFNSEAFGTPTDWFIRVFIPLKNRPLTYIDNEFFHPTFLYESIWNMLIFGLLFFIIRPKFKQTGGVITLSYLILYSIGRFFIEAIRTDNIYNILGMPIAQFTSIILIVIGVIGLLLLRFKAAFRNFF